MTTTTHYTDDPRRKMRDVNEFRRWYDAGHSYRWMADEYKRKYGDTVAPTMFSNWRIKLGLRPRLAVRDRRIIPWDVREEHQTLLPMRMLQLEARRQRKLALTPLQLRRHESWRQKLEEGNLVVHYEPETEQGFFYVPRREGVDTGLVRVPDEDLGD